MKKILSVVICLFLLTAMIVPASAEGALYASISAGSGSAYPGDTVDFYIYISGSGTCASLGCALNYDSSVFEFVGGSVYDGSAMAGSMDSDGLFLLYGGPSTPSGTVAAFTMRVRDGASYGSSYVSIDGYAQDASVSGDGTSVTVVCNHSYSDWQKYDGSYHQKTCGSCGDTKEEEHGWNDGAVVSAPSCKDQGTMTYTCITCGETKDEVLEVTDEHTYGAFQKVDDNQHKSTCSVCGKPLTASHTWDAGTVTKKETCKETGMIKYTCADCGHTREEVIPVSTVHTFSAWSKVDDNKHSRSCSVCEKTETKDHNWNEGAVTKKPNCMETGSCIYTCLDCNTSRTEELPISDTHTYDHGCDAECNVCSEERTTSHSYEDGWFKDSTEHWHECVNCGEIADAEDHIPGPEATEEEAQLCTVCDYILNPALTHEHDFGETYAKDKTGHWYACTGCEEKKDFVNHAFTSACDGLCDVCGFTRQVSHDIGQKWYADTRSHYQKCQNCSKQESHMRHSAGPEATELTPQTCEVCGYVMTPALGHSFETQWSSDQQTHYYSCACGEKKDVANHTWDEGVKADYGKIFTCTVCQHQEVVSRNLTPIIVAGSVAVVAMAGLGIAIATLVKRRRM